jgi:hypothetical protein
LSEALGFSHLEPLSFICSSARKRPAVWPAGLFCSSSLTK